MKSSIKNASLILKILTFSAAVIGTFLSAYAGRQSFMGGSSVFMYFTIQSNIAIAMICILGLILLMRGKKIPLVWQVIKFVGTVSITLTGAVFCYVLAPTMGPYAWNLQNILTHVIVPLSAIIDFFLVAPTGQLSGRHVPFVTIPPICYAIYAGIGYAAGWEVAPGINYPYFFLNWGSPAGVFGFSKELPFMGCEWWILALLLLLIGVGYLYLFIVNLLRNSSINDHIRNQH